MAPRPEGDAIKVDLDTEALADDDVVISGMSGLMPNCNNLSEFCEKLYNKENLANNKNLRWNCEHPELPKHAGNMPTIDKFDTQFFMIHTRMAHAIDSMTRLMLEHTYQALFDAGINSTEFSGKKVAVFIGPSYSETEMVAAYSSSRYGLLALSRTMTANRISFWLNAKGPSSVVDGASCSTLVALERAYKAIMQGECEAAIVAGAKLLLHPQSYINYQRMTTIAPDGKTKCYDKNADGHVISEAACVILIQKYKDAKRVYASLRYINTRFLPELSCCEEPLARTSKNIVGFLDDFYDTANVSPSLVEYVEGCGGAILDTEKFELEAFDRVFCKNRSNPLNVGSVMSNIGYTDAVSGLAAIVKILLAYKTGTIAATINCDNPRNDVPALGDGRMRIANEHQPFGRTYAAANLFGFAGLNVHALFKGWYKPKDNSNYKTNIPYLITASGRHEEAVKKILDYVKSRPIDPEEVGLLHNFFKLSVWSHMSRGYTIISSKEEKTVSISEQICVADVVKKPLWFVYSGMGSQWNCMGFQLMRIPIFAAAIERCNKVLEPRGVDIYHILTSPDEHVYENILNSFVGIAAVQIGLTDVLHSIGLVPDKIIGHSVGELGCAYADGCFTTEEMILAAYSRGLVSVQTPFTKGSMAAVGIGYKKILNMCPPEIEVACHNGPDSSTISGPADEMKVFVAKLTEAGVFAKEVPCSNIAYHSRYIVEAGPELLNRLKNVIKVPKPRSDRWLSTSVPENEWNSPLAKYSSAEYHTNNLLSPVLFEETSNLVPANAVLVEVAPHGLLQAILKRSLHNTCRHIPLTRRGHEDNSAFLLEAIGRLYNEGYDINISILYPKIKFPVSNETPMLSHLVEWNHTDTMRVCNFAGANRKFTSVNNPIISIYDTEYQYLKGCVIKGKIVYPFAAALVLVWDTMCMTLGKSQHDQSVEFRNIHLHDQPFVNQNSLYLNVSIQKGSGRFEVTNCGQLIVSGHILTVLNEVYPLEETEGSDEMVLSTTDIYKLFYEKGYQYTGEFRSVHSSNLSLTKAQMVKNSNWVTLLDGLIQLNALKRGYNGISHPKFIQSIIINLEKHIKYLTFEKSRLINVQLYESHNQTRCGGLTIRNISFKEAPTVMVPPTGLKLLYFVPFFSEANVDISATIYMFLQVVSENLNKSDLNIKIINNYRNTFDFGQLKPLLDSFPIINLNIVNIDNTKITPASGDIFNNSDIVFISDIISNKKVAEILYQVINPNTFVISMGIDTSHYPRSIYQPVCGVGNKHSRAELALWRPKINNITDIVSIKTENDINYLRSIQRCMPRKQKRLIISSYPPLSELKKLVKEWRADHKEIYLAMIDNNKLDEVNFDNFAELKLAYNTLQKGVWGSHYYLPIQEQTENRKELVALRSSQLGDINSLCWEEVPEPTESGIQVLVRYAAINNCDVNQATSDVPLNSFCGYGMDFSGVTKSGERVMGLIPRGAISQKVVAKSNLLWPVPDYWTLEEAATVPLPYAIAYYCLMKITYWWTPPLTILVHGGAGSLGQAVISLALAYGCTIFTTVSDIRKKHFLKKLFPELKDEYIGCSRDLSFGDMILNATKQEGARVVINCIKGKLRNVSLKCSSNCAVFLDTVHIPQQDGHVFGMSHLSSDHSYVTVDISTIFLPKYEHEQMKLQSLVTNGIAHGHVRPITSIVYEPQDVVRAINLLGGSRHRGRVLIKINDHVTAKTYRYISLPNECHLIVCDKEGLGIQLADFLVQRGVKKLQLHLLSSSGYLELKKDLWEKAGVKVKISFGELNKEGAVNAMMKENNLGPIEALFILNTDSSIDQFQAENIINNIDLSSRTLYPNLKYFMVITETEGFGQNINADRVKNKLPSTILYLNNIAHFEEFEEGKITRENKLMRLNILKLIERSLISGKHELVSYVPIKTQMSLLDEIKKVLEFIDKIPENITLENIGLDNAKAVQLQWLLKSKFNLYVSKKRLLRMTIEKLNKLYKESICVDLNKQTNGFEGLLTASMFETDEVTATADMVQLPTLLFPLTKFTEEYGLNSTILCIVPGMEGHRNRFTKLCERLKLSAIVLQPLIQNKNETLRETAQYLVNIMIKRLKKENRFFLLGYETSVVLVLEMAKILEDLGLTGIVYCVGGTPEEVHADLQSKLGDLESDALPNQLIEYIFEILTGCKSEILKMKLKESKSLDEKIKACMTMLRGQVPYTFQYIQTVIKSVYLKVQMLHKYYKETHWSLRSKIVFLKSNIPPYDVPNTNVNVSNQLIYTHQLNASLPYCTLDTQCSNIINQYLDEDIVALYEAENHCDYTYESTASYII